MFHLQHHGAVLNNFVKTLDNFEEKLKMILTGLSTSEQAHYAALAKYWQLKESGNADAGDMELYEARCRKEYKNAVKRVNWGIVPAEKWTPDSVHEKFKQLKEAKASKGYAKRVEKYRKEFAGLVKAVDWKAIPKVEWTPDGMKGLPLIGR